MNSGNASSALAPPGHTSVDFPENRAAEEGKNALKPMIRLRKAPILAGEITGNNRDRSGNNREPLRD
jgi:hypothetical protein